MALFLSEKHTPRTNKKQTNKQASNNNNTTNDNSDVLLYFGQISTSPNYQIARNYRILSIFKDLVGCLRLVKRSGIFI